MLTVAEAAACQHDRQVSGGMAAGVAQVTAEEHHGPVEQGSALFPRVAELDQEVAEGAHLFQLHGPQLRDLGRILELLVRGSASLQAVTLVFLYTLPNTLLLTIPMTVLVGILLGLSRLSADSEVTAMRAAGRVSCT